MNFLAALVALLLYQWRGAMPWIQRDAWYGVWSRAVSGQAGPLTQHGRWRLLVGQALPVLAVLLLLHVVGGCWFGMPAFFINLGVLLYAIGRGDIKRQIAALAADLERDDLQGAAHVAATFNPGRYQDYADNEAAFCREIAQKSCYRFLEHHFAVIFWFAVAGAPGALWYRLAVIDCELSAAGDARGDGARAWLQVLEWLPVRLLGLTLPIGEKFRDGFTQWLKLLFGIRNHGELLLAYVTVVEPEVAALANSGQLLRMTALFRRALMIWLVVGAVAVIFA